MNRSLSMSFKFSVITSMLASGLMFAQTPPVGGAGGAGGAGAAGATGAATGLGLSTAALVGIGVAAAGLTLAATTNSNNTTGTTGTR